MIVSFLIAATSVAFSLYDGSLLWLGLGVLFATRGYRTLAWARANDRPPSADSRDSRLRLVFRRTACGFAIAGVLCAASTLSEGERHGLIIGLFLLAYGVVHWFAPKLLEGTDESRWPTRWFP